MKLTKKLIALALAVLMALTATAALAKSVEPEDTELDHFAGATLHATVGSYNETTKTFTVTLYDDDRYDAEDIEKMEIGDILLCGGEVYRVKEKKMLEDGDIETVMEDGTEINFIQVGDDGMVAQSPDDDRRFMHAFAVLQLPAAWNIILEDASDVEKEEPVITVGLEEILKIKAEKEETSIGFDFYATIILVNENLEIARIHQDFDVAQ